MTILQHHQLEQLEASFEHFIRWWFVNLMPVLLELKADSELITISLECHWAGWRKSHP